MQSGIILNDQSTQPLQVLSKVNNITHASIQSAVINDAVLLYIKYSNNKDVFIASIVTKCLNEFLGATWVCNP